MEVLASGQAGTSGVRKREGFLDQGSLTAFRASGEPIRVRVEALKFILAPGTTGWFPRLGQAIPANALRHEHQHKHAQADDGDPVFGQLPIHQHEHQNEGDAEDCPQKGSHDHLYFAAGPNEEADGLFGKIVPLRP
jgi:hypothetical protein